MSEPTCPKCGRPKEYCDWEKMYQDAYGNSCRIAELESQLAAAQKQCERYENALQRVAIMSPGIIEKIACQALEAK